MLRIVAEGAGLGVRGGRCNPDKCQQANELHKATGESVVTEYSDDLNLVQRRMLGNAVLRSL